MNSNRERSGIVSKFIEIITTRLSELILKGVLNKVDKFLISDIWILYFKISIRLNFITLFLFESLCYVL